MPDVMLVGHCGPDAIMLKTVAQRVLPDASVELINDHASLDAALAREVILLVNRELDGDFNTGTGGIDLIRHLSASAVAAPMLLVSNFEEAQLEAQAAGAMPGFGKSNLYHEDTTKRLKDAALQYE
jgi:two-component system chemotaxis response regulator CheY